MIYAIAERHQVDEVKDIRDKALALERYATQAMNFEAEDKAVEIRIRAERKCGQLLKAQPKAPGVKGNPRGRGAKIVRSTNATTQTKTLKEMGISKDQSSQFQKLAEIPDKEFEEALASPTKPCTTGLLKTQELKESPPIDLPDFSEEALWIWGRVMEAERMSLFKQPIADLVESMTSGMQDDMKRLMPTFTNWLEDSK